MMRPSRKTAIEQLVEVRGGVWYAAGLLELLENPHGLPPSVLADLRAWDSGRDENAQTGRPLCVFYDVDDRAKPETWNTLHGFGRYVYSFDYEARRRRAPKWWAEIAKRWNAAYGRPVRC